MPIDSLKLIVFTDEETARKTKNSCILRQAIEISTGDIQYQMTTGSLDGTYDSRISIKVQDGRVLDMDIIHQIGIDGYERIVSVNSKMEYEIIVECSLHKALIGHNVYGGTDDLIPGVAYLHDLLEDLLKFKFPFKYTEWRLMRIDLAEVYSMLSREVCFEWFKAVNNCEFPRRSVIRDGYNGFFSYGTMLGIKGYHKGTEFKKYDKKRLKSCNYEGIAELEKIAENIIRIEVEIKGRKLKELYGDYPYICDVNIDMLYRIYDMEVYRLLKEGKSDLNLVRKISDVRQRLYEMYSPELAGKLLGMWYDLTVSGENVVKNSNKRPTYYRNLKFLKEANISWHGTDIVQLEDSLIPKDFSPIRTDSRRLVGECLEVQEKLFKYRIAV